MADAVNHPSHYTQGGVECIEAIEAAMTPDEFRGYLKGNVIKYVWRSNHKGSLLQDLEKARWYLDRLIGHAFKEKVSKVPTTTWSPIGTVDSTGTEPWVLDK